MAFVGNSIAKWKAETNDIAIREVRPENLWSMYSFILQKPAPKKPAPICTLDSSTHFETKLQLSGYRLQLSAVC